MTNPGLASAILAFALGAALPGNAAPDFSRTVQLGELELYPDHERPKRFYYAPRDLELSVDTEGRPEFDLVRMSFSGSSVSGDANEIRHSGRLTFRIRMTPLPQGALLAARKAAGAGSKILPLPLRRVESVLHYGRLEGGGEAQSLGSGKLQADGGSKAGAGRIFDRVVTLQLNATEAEALSEAFRSGSTVMSLGYAYLADGVENDAAVVEIQGDDRMVEELEALIAEGEAEARGTTRLVHSGTASVSVDLERWPDLLRDVVIDSNVPPGFPMLQVLCFDFANDLRPDLILKRVEIEVPGIGNGTVKQEVKFRKKHSDVTSASVNFKFAVRLDRAFRYRVTDYLISGSVLPGDWHERSDFVSPLDVTSIVEEGNALDGTSTEGEP